MLVSKNILKLLSYKAKDMGDKKKIIIETIISFCEFISHFFASALFPLYGYACA